MIYVFIMISIIIVVFSITDLAKNINDTNTDTMLTKTKKRLEIAAVVFVIPLGLSFIKSIFNNLSTSFSNDVKEEIIDTNKNYLDTNYIVYNDEINDVSSEDFSNNDNQILEVSNNTEENNTIEKTDNQIITTDKNEIEETSIITYTEEKKTDNKITEEDNNYKQNSSDTYVSVTNKQSNNTTTSNSTTTNRSTNNSSTKNESNNKKENTTNTKNTTSKEQIKEEEKKVVYNANTTVVNNTNELIANNQPIVTTVNNYKYYNQCDSMWQTKGFCSSGYSMCNNGCGATAIAMIASTLGNNENTTPLDVRDYLCNNKLHSNGGMSYEPFTNKGLLNNYGLESNVFIKYNDNSKYDETKATAIKNEVEKGNGVILLIPGHYVVIGKNSECNNNQVYMYDPASRSDSMCYTMEELWNKTWNRKNRCSNQKKCGWRMAWSYTGFRG